MFGHTSGYAGVKHHTRNSREIVAINRCYACGSTQFVLIFRPINGTLGVERDMPMVLHDAMPNPFLLPPYEIDPLDGIGAVQQDFTNKKKQCKAEMKKSTCTVIEEISYTHSSSCLFMMCTYEGIEPAKT